MSDEPADIDIDIDLDKRPSQPSVVTALGSGS